MRTLAIVLLLLGLGAIRAPSAGARRALRVTRCCLVIPLPAVPARPSCVQLSVPRRRRIGPKLACRLIGGRPIGKGDCTLAACDAGAS